MRGYSLIVAVGVMLTTAAPAAAQQLEALTPGTRIRLWTEPLGARWTLGPPQIEGTLREWRGDTLLVLARGQMLAVPRAALIGVDARLPSRRTGQGAALGLLLGAAVGALAAPGGESYCAGDVCGFDRGGERRLLWSVAGGAAGAVVGGVIGARLRTLAWQSVRPARRRPAG